MSALYYDDGTVQIWHGDVREFAGTEGVACTVSSPPYNVGLNYDERSDFLPWCDYWAMAQHIASVVDKSSVTGARVWWNTAVSIPVEPTKGAHHSGRTGKRRLPLHHRWADIFEEAGFDWVDEVAWTSMRGSGTAWGSYQMPTAPNLRGDWEAVNLLCKGQWERTPPEGMQGWQDLDGGWPELCTTVWTMPPERRDEHPAPFPMALAIAAIRLSTWPGELVLDPFCGSGTTLRASKDLGRKAIGVELSERYCEIAAKRCAQEVLL